MEKKIDTRRLVVSALMIALGTVLSVLSFAGPWALGGGITICSMLPLVLLSWNYGIKWGAFSAFVYSLLQLLLGINNVQYASSTLMALGIILFDYVVAFTVIGLSGMFKGKIKSTKAAMIAGMAVTFTLRFLCHFGTGVVIWEVLWPNELGWAPPVWSLAYNGSYMLPELIITSVVVLIVGDFSRLFKTSSAA